MELYLIRIISLILLYLLHFILNFVMQHGLCLGEFVYIKFDGLNLVQF